MAISSKDWPDCTEEPLTKDVVNRRVIHKKDTFSKDGNKWRLINKTAKLLGYPWRFTLAHKLVKKESIEQIIIGKKMPATSRYVDCSSIYARRIHVSVQ